MDKNKAVLDFISQNFFQDLIQIEEFPLFPFGRKITDQNGDQMIVYYDLLLDRVNYSFPD
jgi:hypothetical protein